MTWPPLSGRPWPTAEVELRDQPDKTVWQLRDTQSGRQP
jgi:hypothetical protein